MENIDKEKTDNLGGSDMTVSFRERMEELDNRGIAEDSLFSDWCVTCVHSIRIKDGICGTGCNGFPEFYTMKNGIRIFTGTPLRYEQENGTEDIE
ncbi:MAG: hypothetical protein ACYDAP_00230 [Thermoplasmataceae archaeon]